MSLTSYRAAPPRDPEMQQQDAADLYERKVFRSKTSKRQFWAGNSMDYKPLRLTMIPQASAVCQGPIDEKCAADDVVRWKVTPIPGIEAVECVIPHYHDVSFRNLDALGLVL